MNTRELKHTLSRTLTEYYGMLLALFLLCAFFSCVTWNEQHPTGVAGAEDVGGEIVGRDVARRRVLIVARANQEDRIFADRLKEILTAVDLEVVAVVNGEAIDARRALEEQVAASTSLDYIAANYYSSLWGPLKNLKTEFPALAAAELVRPRSYYWPNFLKTENLLNVASQIVVIAVIAIGMTMVIITGGIDLSVGSLIALSAVVTARLIGGWEEWMDAEAGVLGLTLCALGGILVCALAGLISGFLVVLAVPPFIATLSMLLIAKGLAFIGAEGRPVAIPASFQWLGQGSDVLGLPNSVVLMAILYIGAHVMMTRMTLGRYIYAVGGNAEAARLSGVPITLVRLFVYTACGALAGLGGIVRASELKSGDPNFGTLQELKVIAACVVGGTSLSGGEGKIFGTLIGAFILGVIQNGMNLTGVESYPQQVVLGLVILCVVLIDTLKKRGWKLLPRP